MNASAQPRPNPFPGLRPFRSDEHHLFFGREEQTAALLQLLRTNRFLAVVGTSGSGKSSLVRAGMIAELHGGTMTHAGSAWEVMILRPGGSPIRNLARAFVEAELYDPDDPGTLPRLLATLNRSRFGLVEAMKQSEIFAPETNLLVVVDQFEELFRFRQQGIDSEEAATAFVNLLLTASEQSECPIYVTITMRSDYLGDCSEIPGLAEAVNDGEYLIPRLQRDQKRDAIEKPVGVGGAKISPLLVQRLLNDVGDDPDQLPVLQHALMRMWDAWSESGDPGRPIELEHFEATGGLTAALSNHADEIFVSLPDSRHREACEKIFKTLTEKGDDNRGIRRPTRLAQLQAIAGSDRRTVIAVLDAYRDAGVTFLMPGMEVELLDRTVLDLSHESLMRGWQRLRGWVEEEAQSARIFRRLLDTGRLWRDGKAGLFRDPDLQIALSWRDQEQPNAEWAQQYGGDFDVATRFLDRSHAEVEAEERAQEAARQRELDQARQLAEVQQQQIEQQQRAGARLRKLMARLAVVAALACIASIFALVANNKARRLAALAASQRDYATESATVALQSQQQTVEALALVASQKRDVESSLAKTAQAEQEAREAEERGRQLLYATDMQLAAQNWRDEQVGAKQLREQLDAHVPQNDKADLRGFEWYYSQHLVNESAKIFAIPDVRPIDSALTEDGELVVLDLNARVTRWNPQTRSQLGQFSAIAEGETMRSAALGPDGRIAVIALSNNHVVLVDTTSAERRMTIDAATEVEDIILSADGRMLVTVGRQIRWWNTLNGRLIASADTGATRLLRGLAISNDGLIVAVAGSRGSTGGTVTIYRMDLGTKQVAMTERDFGATRQPVALSPDGQLFATCSFVDGAVLICETNGFQTVASHATAHSSPLSALSFSSDGRQLITADGNGMIKVWNDPRKLASPQYVLKGHDQAVRRVLRARDGRQVVSASDDFTVRIWELPPSGAITELTRADRMIRSSTAQFSPDGLLIVAADSSRELSLWDAATGQRLRSLAGETRGNLYATAVSPDNRVLAAGFSGGAEISEVVLWDIDTGENLAVLAGTTDLPDFQTNASTGIVNSLAFSPDGLRLVAGFGTPHSFGFNSYANPIKVWDVATRQVIRVLQGHSNTGTTLAFSPDGSKLASGNHDGTAIIWDAIAWKPLHTLRNPGYNGFINNYVMGVAFSPDNQTLALASYIGDVNLWDVTTGALRESLTGHSNVVAAVGFSPDGLTLASAGWDQTVRLWNVATSRELLQLDSGGVSLGDLYNLSFSPDGRQLMFSGDRIALWSTAPVIWNDPSRAAAKLALLRDSKADFRARIRMLSGQIGLSEALTELQQQRPDDRLVQAALAAAEAHWYAWREEWSESAAALERLIALDAGPPEAWLQTVCLLRVAHALVNEDRPVLAAALLHGGEQLRRQDGLPAITAGRVLDDPVTGPVIQSLQTTVNSKLEAKPQDAGLLELRAELAGQWSGSEQQVADYTAALDILTTLPDDGAARDDIRRLYGRRGMAYSALSQWQPALADFELAVRDGMADEELLAQQTLARANSILEPPTQDWTVLRPADPRSGTVPELTFLEDGSVVVASAPAAELPTIRFEPGPQPVQALRVESRSHSEASSGGTPVFSEYLVVATGMPGTAQETLRGRFVRLDLPGDNRQFPRHPDDGDRKSINLAELQVFQGDQNIALGKPARLSGEFGDQFGADFAVDGNTVGNDSGNPYAHSPIEDNPWWEVDLGSEQAIDRMVVWNRNEAGRYSILYQRMAHFRIRVLDESRRVVFERVIDAAPNPSTEIIPPALSGESDIGTSEVTEPWLVRLPVIGSPGGARQYRISVADSLVDLSSEDLPPEVRSATDPWVRLAAAYRLQGNQAAIDDLVRTRPQAAGLIGDMFAADGDWPRAIELYSMGITPDTADSRLVSRRALAHEASQAWDLAAADWNRAASGNPDGATLLAEFRDRLPAAQQDSPGIELLHQTQQLWEAVLETDPRQHTAMTSLTRLLTSVNRDRNLILPTSEDSEQIWAWTTSQPPSDWMDPDFDDSAWVRGPGVFGRPAAGIPVRTTWDTPDIWIRQTFEFEQAADQRPVFLRIAHDDMAIIFVNGHELTRFPGWTGGYAEEALTAEQLRHFRTGVNTIAVTCNSTNGAQFIDVGLRRGLPENSISVSAATDLACAYARAGDIARATHWFAGEMDQLDNEQERQKVVDAATPFENVLSSLFERRPDDPLLQLAVAGSILSAGTGAPSEEAASTTLGDLHDAERLFESFLARNPDNNPVALSPTEANSEPGANQSPQSWSRLPSDRIATTAAALGRASGLQGHLRKASEYFAIAVEQATDRTQKSLFITDAFSVEGVADDLAGKFPEDSQVQAAFVRYLTDRGDSERAESWRAKTIAAFDAQFAGTPDDPALADQLADVLLADSSGWTVLEPVSLASEMGATLTALSDDSILASGPNLLGDAYTICARADVDHLSVIRLEALTHPSLPAHGPGRDESRDPGNFSMTDWTITATSSDGEPVPVLLSQAAADYWVAHIPVTTTNWNIGGGASSRPHAAVFLLEHPLDVTPGPLRLQFHMQFSDLAEWPLQNLGRFRLSVTDDPAAFGREQQRFQALRNSNPWAKLALANSLMGDSAAVERIMEQHPELAAALGDHYAADKDWQQAVGMYSRVISDETTDSALLIKRATAYEGLGDAEAAAADLSRAMVTLLQTPDQAQTAFDTFRKAGRWNEAIPFGEILLEKNPEDTILWMTVAAMSVLAGDEDGYQTVCRRMTQHFGESLSAEVADRVCKACLLAPASIEREVLPTDVLVRAMDNGTADTGLLRWFWTCRALIAYRSGASRFAVECINNVTDTDSFVANRVLGLVIRALAQHQLGDRAAAESDLTLARQLAGPLVESDRETRHHDVLIAGILLAEAEAVFAGTIGHNDPEGLRLAHKTDNGRLLHQAIAESTRVIEQDPKDAQALMRRGRLYEQVREWDAAAADWSCAADLHPDGPGLLTAFSARLRSAGRSEPADELLHRIRRLYEARLDQDPQDYLTADALTDFLTSASTDEQWSILVPAEMSSQGGAELTLQEDGSILASGNNITRDIYTLVVEGDRDIASVRLEALPDESLPQSGPGRHTTGNFQLSAFRLFRSGPDAVSQRTPVPLQRAIASFAYSANDADVSGTIDDKLKKVWHIWGRFGERHTAEYLLRQPVSLRDGERLTIVLEHSGGHDGINLGRFRLATTSKSTDAEQLATVSGPWARLAAAYYLSGDQAAVDNLLQHHPEAESGLADIYAFQQDWERAIQVYDAVLTARPGDVHVLKKRATAHEQLGNHDAALADWLAAVKSDPALQSDVFARLMKAERWTDAAAIGLQIIDRTPQFAAMWLSLAPLLAVSESSADYADFCRRLVAQFGTTSDATQATYVIKAGLLLPGVCDVSALPVDAFVRPLDDGTVTASLQNSRWGLRGLLAYRSGDADAALRYIDIAQQLNPPEWSIAFNLPVRAMALHQLQRTDEARVALKEALPILERLRTHNVYRTHRDRLIAEILFREAEALINQSAGRPATTESPTPDP